MHYIDTITSRYPVSEAEIRQAFANTSFPMPFEPLPPYAAVVQAPCPSFDAVTQVAVALPPARVGDHYEAGWRVEALDEATRRRNRQGAQTAVLAKIDSDVDAVYTAVQGNRLSEYQLAEAQASAFKAVGYAGEAPASVQAWAAAQRETAQWAADSILAKAAAWRNAQSALRERRLALKAAARGANDSAALADVQARWNGFLVGLRLELGLA